eukprot:COSAG06_NODE_2178_length_7407_cov_8.831554_7_plen_226_part_00
MGLVPDTYLPLQCIVMVELISPPLCFGELEMMRIGGGACGCGGADNWCGNCGRTRTMTAKAMTESRMCRLSSESFATLRALYPQHMGNNRNFALRKADKKDPQLKLKQTRRRKRTTNSMFHTDPGSGHTPRQMTSTVDSLDELSTASFGTTNAADSDINVKPAGAGAAAAADSTAPGGQQTADGMMSVNLAAFKESVIQEVKEEMSRSQGEIKAMLAQLIKAQHT